MSAIRRELDARRLFEYLYRNNPSTVPKIAKALNVDPTTARYHLEKLVEKGLVIKEEKRYGAKYHVNPSLTKAPLRFYVSLAIAYVPYVSALLILPLGRCFEASLLLAVSSTLGLVQSYLQLHRFRRTRLEELLKLL